MADQQYPELEACGNLIRTKRTAEDDSGWLVGECSGAERAERLVRCWNSHDELVSLLQRYVDLDVTHDAMKRNTFLQDSNLHRSARAAIAKANA